MNEDFNELNPQGKTSLNRALILALYMVFYINTSFRVFDPTLATSHGNKPAGTYHHFQYPFHHSAIRTYWHPRIRSSSRLPGGSWMDDGKITPKQTDSQHIGCLSHTVAQNSMTLDS